MLNLLHKLNPLIFSIMKKYKEPYSQGTEPVFGKTAKRLHHLIMNPRKAKPEELERMKQSCIKLNGGNLLW